jgi:hypothetical protein
MKLLYRISIGTEYDRTHNELHTDVVRSILKSVRETLTDMFGGCNIVSGQGGYKMENGVHVSEKSAVIEVYAGLDDKHKLIGVCRGIATLLNAESVLLSAQTCIVFEDIRQ